MDTQPRVWPAVSMAPESPRLSCFQQGTVGTEQPLLWHMNHWALRMSSWEASRPQALASHLCDKKDLPRVLRRISGRQGSGPRRCGGGWAVQPPSRTRHPPPGCCPQLGSTPPSTPQGRQLGPGLLSTPDSSAGIQGVEGHAAVPLTPAGQRHHCSSGA